MSLIRGVSDNYICKSRRMTFFDSSCAVLPRKREVIIQVYLLGNDRPLSAVVARVLVVDCD